MSYIAIYPEDGNDIVISVNGNPLQTPVPVYLLPLTDADFFYCSWENIPLVATCSTNTLLLQDSKQTQYNPTIMAFTGGRPPQAPRKPWF